ncbi:unnamed protein product [Protopolystoma xenopodis]|uniref:Uncharacterized protein n=1 Tax=Protopolystoma xenopodis TaxID=117903 RepID=A0A3S5BQM4_9PLAT|nr:unnamed protein product [Protopolystoma xenopodis]
MPRFPSHLSLQRPSDLSSLSNSPIVITSNKVNSDGKVSPNVNIPAKRDASFIKGNIGTSSEINTISDTVANNIIKDSSLNYCKISSDISALSRPEFIGSGSISSSTTMTTTTAVEFSKGITETKANSSPNNSSTDSPSYSFSSDSCCLVWDPKGISENKLLPHDFSSHPIHLSPVPSPSIPEPTRSTLKELSSSVCLASSHSPSLCSFSANCVFSNSAHMDGYTGNDDLTRPVNKPSSAISTHVNKPISHSFASHMMEVHRLLRPMASTSQTSVTLPDEVTKCCAISPHSVSNANDAVLNNQDALNVFYDDLNSPAVHQSVANAVTEAAGDPRGSQNPDYRGVLPPVCLPYATLVSSNSKASSAQKYFSPKSQIGQNAPAAGLTLPNPSYNATSAVASSSSQPPLHPLSSPQIRPTSHILVSRKKPSVAAPGRKKNGPTAVHLIIPSWRRASDGGCVSQPASGRRSVNDQQPQQQQLPGDGKHSEQLIRVG